MEIQVASQLRQVIGVAKRFMPPKIGRPRGVASAISRACAGSPEGWRPEHSGFGLSTRMVTGRHVYSGWLTAGAALAGGLVKFSQSAVAIAGYPSQRRLNIPKTELVACPRRHNVTAHEHGGKSIVCNCIQVTGRAWLSVKRY